MIAGWVERARQVGRRRPPGRVVVMGRLQQRTWAAEDGSARQAVEVVADELGASLQWATTTTTRATRGRDR